VRRFAFAGVDDECAHDEIGRVGTPIRLVAQSNVGPIGRALRGHEAERFVGSSEIEATRIFEGLSRNEARGFDGMQEDGGDVGGMKFAYRPPKSGAETGVEEAGAFRCQSKRSVHAITPAARGAGVTE